MRRRELTEKQRAVLAFIRTFVEAQRIWPTYRDIREAFGFRSPHSVTQHLKALRRKGYLVYSTASGYRLVDETAEARGIPVRGIVTAGYLQEAVEDDLGTITLETVLPNLDRIFAVRVSGQSMQGADIYDGDYVLLIDDDIPNGGIGAVLYDGETSLKYVFHDEDGLRLEPANEDYPTIRITPDIFEEVRVLGRYVGHVNRRGLVTDTRAAAYSA